MRYLTGEEARDLGVLLEVNRRLLHPRGLALEATVPLDPAEEVATLYLRTAALEKLHELAKVIRENELMPVEWCDQLDKNLAAATPGATAFRIEDHDDPEGVVFGSGNTAERVAKSRQFDELLVPERFERLGFVLEPIE